MSQTYTLCQIKHNNGKNGKPAWIVVKGVVYDVTNFLNEHPGGDSSIMEYAGKDATKAFIQVGHSKDAINNMKLYKIGTVAAECTLYVKCEETTTSANGVITDCPKLSNCSTHKVIAESTKQCCGNPEEKPLKLFCCC